MEIEIKKKNFRETMSNSVQEEWWDSEGDDIAVASQIQMDNIINHQYHYHSNTFLYGGLYENVSNTCSNSPYFKFMTIITPRADNKSLTYNIVKSCVDSYTNNITRSVPNVKIQTSGGTYDQQKQAKQLTKFTNGVLNHSKFHDAEFDAVRDAAVFGLGAIKIFEEDGKIDFKRVKAPTELILDYEDSKSGSPTILHYRYLMSKRKLMERYPEHADSIMDIPDYDNHYYSAVAQVVVRECWHLKSTNKSKDGKFAICVEGLTLHSEEYDEDYFPFLFFRHTDRMDSFYGYGLTEELAYIQYAINKIHKMIEIGQAINCAPRAFVTAGSVVSGMDSLYQAGVVEIAAGAPLPQAFTGSATSSDMYQFLSDLYSKAYALSGVSQLSASAQKPSGLDSGVALREYKDSVSGRFVRQGKKREELYKDACKMIINLAKKSKNKIISYVDGPDRQFVEEIDFSQITINNDFFVAEIFPVSSLPDSPEGRLQTVTELFKIGAIDMQQFTELLELPDLESLSNQKNASIKVVNYDLDQIMEGEVILPDPVVNLAIAKSLCQSRYLENVNDDKIDQSIKDALLNYFNEAVRLDLEIKQKIAEATQAQPPQQTL